MLFKYSSLGGSSFHQLNYNHPQGHCQNLQLGRLGALAGWGSLPERVLAKSDYKMGSSIQGSTT